MQMMSETEARWKAGGGSRSVQNSSNVLCGPQEGCGGTGAGDRGLELAQVWRSHKEFGLQPKNNRAPLASSKQGSDSHFVKTALIAEHKKNCRGGV